MTFFPLLYASVIGKKVQFLIDSVSSMNLHLFFLSTLFDR